MTKLILQKLMKFLKAVKAKNAFSIIVFSKERKCLR